MQRTTTVAIDDPNTPEPPDSTTHELCVFEELVRIAPVGEAAKSLNICRICHARVLAEHMGNAPIYWSGCPYVELKNS